MKTQLLFALALFVAVTTASISNQDANRSSLRDFLIRTNESPKNADGNIWDVIMIRGANGQLTSFADHRRQQAEANSVCDDCKVIARYLALAVKEGESLEKFKGTLKLLCDLLDEQEQASCRNIIDNLDVLIEKLDPLLKDPELFCKELSLCATQNVPRVIRLLVRWGAARTRGVNPANDVVCDECQFVVTQLRSIMNEQSTKDDVKGFLDSLCSYFGGSTGEKCVQIVNQYFYLIWDELIALMADARGICIDVELCNNTRVQARPRSSMLRLVPASIARLFNNRRRPDLPARQTLRLDSAQRFLRRIQTEQGVKASCAVCKLGWTALLAALKADKSMQQNVSDAVRKLACDKILPQAYNLDCNDWLGLYLPPIIFMTLDDINPAQVCDMMHMCTASDSAALDAMSTSEKATVLCQACTVASEFLQHELNDRSMQDDIVHYLEQECREFPGDMVEECKSLIDTYAPALFQTLVQELNPQVACPALHMCPQVDNADDSKEVKTSSNEDVL